MSLARRDLTPVVDFTPLQRMRGHTFDPWHLFVERVPIMIEEAREIREQDTESYRIKVGSVALATDAAGLSVGIFPGGNTKLNKADVKVCAETRAIRRAEKAGLTNIIGLVVVGDPQADDGSGLDSPILHCCEECRVGNLTKKCNDDTLILTAHPFKDKFQLQTAHEMIDLHDAVARGEEAEEPPLFHDPGFRRWETSRANYGLILLREGIERVDALIQPPERPIVIAAARTAITGYALAA